MLCARLGDKTPYDFSGVEFETAFDFLRRDDLLTLSEGWIELDNGVRASVQKYTTVSPTTVSFETHINYIDIQYMLEGTERIGIFRREGLRAKTQYDSADDIIFYEDPEMAGELLLNKGDYAVFMPLDAHKPRLTAPLPMPVRKIVLKVPVR